MNNTKILMHEILKAPALKIPSGHVPGQHLGNILLLILVVAVTSMMMPTSPASAKVIIREQTKYYNVSGRTGRQVHDKFGHRGPRKMRRKHAIAATLGEFDFKDIKFAKRGNRCVVSKVVIQLKLTYYYPRWVNKKSASRNSQKLWRSFTKELVRHEQTHGKYFKETMRQIERDVKRASGRISTGCRNLSKSVLRAVKRTYKKGERKHDAFDRREKRSTTKVRKLERAFIKSK